MMNRKFNILYIRIDLDITGTLLIKNNNVGELTALPIFAVASLALSTCVSWMLRAKDLVRWDTNSTEMPTAWRPYRNRRLIG